MNPYGRVEEVLDIIVSNICICGSGLLICALPILDISFVNMKQRVFLDIIDGLQREVSLSIAYLQFLH